MNKKRKTPKQVPMFAVFEGLKEGNRFYSTNCPEEDQTKLADGTVAYKIIGYANTHEEALAIINSDGKEQVRMLQALAGPLKQLSEALANLKI